MDFFRQLDALELAGNLKMVVRRVGESQLVVTLLLDNPEATDPAKAVIPPLMLRDTAANLDAGFFETITKPMQDTSSLQQTMANYTKALKLAQENSKQASDQKGAEKKEKDAQKTKFDKAMGVVGQLEKENKFREAYAKMPDETECSAFAPQIKAKKAELKAKFTAPGLFDLFTLPEPQTPQNDDQPVADFLEEDNEEEVEEINEE